MHPLERFIQESVDALARDAGERREADGSLLFLGAWSDAVPRLLIEDPVLAPTDKVVWQVIKLRARAGGATAFPDYPTIGRLANVGSSATVARAIAMLRIARWLTLCARVRDAGGRFRGNVYALHDEPLALGDTLYLDPEHMSFLEAACAHAHGRVRRVAAASRATIADDVRRGVDVTAVPATLARRAEAMETLHARAQGGFFSFNRERLSELRRPPTRPPSESEGGAGEAGARISEGGDAPCSSSCSRTEEKTTTTTPAGAAARAREAGELHFPARLDANHRALASLYLEPVPASLRQAVLDELEGRLGAERRGAPAVYDPLRFFKRLCELAAGGRFAPNLGLAVRGAREREAAARAQQVASTPPPTEAPDLDNPLVRRVLEIRAKRDTGKRSR